eukprot:scaffold106600_cov19-Tisochrysis_lutea.AAC.1
MHSNVPYDSQGCPGAMSISLMIPNWRMTSGSKLTRMSIETCRAGSQIWRVCDCMCVLQIMARPCISCLTLLPIQLGPLTCPRSAEPPIVLRITIIFGHQGSIPL